jgi:hypothetical protein
VSGARREDSAQRELPRPSPWAEMAEPAMTSGVASASWRLATPSTVGAVAVIEICDESGRIGPTLEHLGLGGIVSDACQLRDLLGVDRGLVARLGDRIAWLMPHGGIGVVRALCAALESRGVVRASAVDPRTAYPEASDAIEARMLVALARAASPLAIDLLLDQPRRWREPGATSDPRRDAILARLLTPPLVVAVGASNIGKSTLLNTLAGRGVSIVADEPGTTRDHVGVMLDVGGLWVRFIDTPGVRDGLDAAADSVELDAAAAARRLAERADLVLACGDPRHPPLDIGATSRLAVCLRSDLGEPHWPCTARVSCRNLAGVESLVAMVRESLVPISALSHPGAWRFWEQ